MQVILCIMGTWSDCRARTSSLIVVSPYRWRWPNFLSFLKGPPVPREFMGLLFPAPYNLTINKSFIITSGPPVDIRL